MKIELPTPPPTAPLRGCSRTASHRLLLVTVLAAGLSAGLAADNDKGGGNAGTQGKGKPTLIERPTVIPAEPKVEDVGKGKPATPGRPDQAVNPASVQQLVKDFQTARESYLEQQKTLARQFQQASEEERKAIREQLKDLLERLKEQQRAFRDEVRERARSLKQELDPSLGRLIDKGTEEGRGR